MPGVKPYIVRRERSEDRPAYAIALFIIIVLAVSGYLLTKEDEKPLLIRQIAGNKPQTTGKSIDYSRSEPTARHPVSTSRDENRVHPSPDQALISNSNGSETVTDVQEIVSLPPPPTAHLVQGSWEVYFERSTSETGRDKILMTLTMTNDTTLRGTRVYVRSSGEWGATVPVTVEWNPQSREISIMDQYNPAEPWLASSRGTMTGTLSFNNRQIVGSWKPYSGGATESRTFNRSGGL